MAKAEAKEDFKSLPPEERIKKLRELERQRKKEIAETEELIHDSEDEIKERRKWVEKVPIPEFSQDDVAGLSEEARQILLQHKGISAKLQEKSLENTDEQEEQKPKKSLEESLASVQVPRSSESPQIEYGARLREAMPGVEYKPLSQQALPDISQAVQYIERKADERGYITGDEQRVVQYAMSEVEKRLEAVEEGRYRGFSEKAAEAASLIQLLGGQLMGQSYNHKGNQMYQ